MVSAPLTSSQVGERGCSRRALLALIFAANRQLARGTGLGLQNGTAANVAFSYGEGELARRIVREGNVLDQESVVISRQRFMPSASVRRLRGRPFATPVRFAP